MEEELQTCNMEFLSISVITVLSILGLIVARKFLQKALELLRCTKMCIPRQNPIAVNLHREVAELRRTTHQISQDWESMVDLMASVKNEQSICKESLQAEIRSMNETLQDTVIMSLEEEYLRNDQRHSKIAKIIDVFRDDLTLLKEMIENHGDVLLKNIQDRKHPQTSLEHMWTQTECEVVIRRKGRTQGETSENDATKLAMLGIKKILSEFQKEARKNATQERDEIMSQVDTILSRLNVDRDDIKNAIQQAFVACSYQNQKGFEEFGRVGQEALQYIAEKSEKSNVLMRDKFREFDKKMKDIFERMYSTSFDVSFIKTTLDNIDSQLDDIFQRVELGCQKNVEHCEDVLNGLETATEVWNESSSRLAEVASQLEVLTSDLKHLLKELNENKVESKEKVALPLSENGAETQDNTNGFAITAAHQDEILLGELKMNTCGLIQLQNMARLCSEKLSSLNDQLENGTKETALAMENLLRQILFVCDLVKNVGERFKFLEVEILSGNDLMVSQNKQFEPDVDMKSEIPTHKLKPIEDRTSMNTIKGSDSKPIGYSNLRSPKKNKATMKLKHTASPIKKGKTIYSDTSPPDVYSKNRERNKSITRNKV